MNGKNEFKSMDEVENAVKWAELALPRSIAEDIRFLFGLSPNEGTGKLVEIGGAPVQIDASIADGIRSLNEMGYRTLACCSGLAEEHLGAKYPRTCGYLAFRYDRGLLSTLEREAASLGIAVEESETYLERSIRVSIKDETDAKILRTWNRLFRFLLDTEGRSVKDGPGASKQTL